jgi:hypothetical protein
MQLELVRRRATLARSIGSEATEYAEVEKEGFAQLYVNGDLVGVVTKREGNDEVILWEDMNTECWRDGKFVCLEYESVSRRYASRAGTAKWKSMWTRDSGWRRPAREAGAGGDSARRTST